MVIEMQTTTVITDAEREDARLLWMFAHPRRMQMIRLLLANPGELMVQEIADRCGIAQPTVSHHLRYFEAQKMVQCHRVGVESYYSIRSEKIQQARAVLDGLLAERE